VSAIGAARLFGGGGASATTSKLWGRLIVLFATVGAGHVLLSSVYVWFLGGGVALSELLLKKVTLCGCAILWHTHHTLDHGADKLSDTPLLPTSSSLSFDYTTSTATGLLLLLGRLLVTGLCSVVTVAGTRRLLFSPLTSFDLYDGHDELRLRLPQLFLSIPLALGVRTKLVTGALAVLMLAEALVVWQWWRMEVLSDFNHFLRVSQHFTINLAVGGGLLLLMVVGSGRFTVDELVKKRT